MFWSKFSDTRLSIKRRFQRNMLRNFRSLCRNLKFYSFRRHRTLEFCQKRLLSGENSGSKWKSFKWLKPLYICTQACSGVIAAGLLSKESDFAEESKGKVVLKGKTLEEAISDSRDLVQRVKDEVGAPGIVIGVSLDGQHVWKEGFGYSDLENRVPCHAETVMRIASISKVITMTIVGKLMENNQLDIDRPIQDYVTEFPEKIFDGDKVTITTRHLLSHLSGIRHYEKAEQIREKKKQAEEEKKTGKKIIEKNTTEFELKEYHIKENFATVKDALKLFKDDELIHKPGTKFLYSTHGWTLVSAVLEGATKKEFPDLLRTLFKDLGLTRTYLDESKALIYGRSRFYMKNKRGKIVNTPYVDNSYKWAGGGLLANVGDLLKFGNVMLYSYQHEPNKQFVRSFKTDTFNKSEKNNIGSEQNMEASLPGYLQRETVLKMWQPNENAKCSWDRDGYFGLGWAVVPSKKQYGCTNEQRFYTSHTGGAVGASSVLIILPRKMYNLESDQAPPSGIVVGIFTNLTSVGLAKVAMDVAKIFEEVDV